MHIPQKLFLSAALFAGATAFATDYYVAAGGTGDYTAGNPGPSPFEAATRATAAGDVIHVAPGLYSYETGAFYVNPGVTMIGGTDNPEDTVIERVVTVRDKDKTNDRVIFLGRKGVLRNLTVRGGYTAYQAACVLGYGYDMIVHKDFSVSNCVIENGSAKYKGGGSYGGVWRDCVIRNCEVRNPTENQPTEGSGGGIWGGTLYNCVITNNTGIFSGGGLAGNAAEPFYAENCLIAYNNAPYGGGAATYHGGTSCRLVNCSVVSNSAVNNYPGQNWGGRGGGVYGCYLTNCVVRGNVATFPLAAADNPLGGGGLSSACAYFCDIVGNRTGMVNGGDWHVSGGGAETSYLEGCRIMDNYSNCYGGGTIYSTNVNCWVSGNSATLGGAALQSVFRSCVISNNVSRSNEAGAAYNSTTYNCLVIHNRSKFGAVLFRGYHQGDLIVGNTTEGVVSRSAGSAISPLDGTDGTKCDAAAVNCTLVGNTGGDAALWAVHATNCLVVGNSPVDVKWMTLADTCMWVTDANASRPDETAAPAVNCTKIADPKFVAQPGKGECAYSLRLSSPCKDKGRSFDWMDGATDLLGNPRVKFGAPDIGAFECCAQYGSTLLVR